MRAFYLAFEKVSQAVRQFEELPFFSIPWGQNVILITKLKDTKERLWYAQQSIEYGWSRSVLEMKIETETYQRSGKAVSNFKTILPPEQSDMAEQSLKDPYIFDFMTLSKEHLEKEIEQGLMDHMQKFLLELSQGFAFVGRQVHINVDEKDYYLDLLFYHITLRCYIVIELKAREFDPRDAGQLGFYLSAVDDQRKGSFDNPSIGLLLCKTKRTLTVEYALRPISGPIAVASYIPKLTESLPKNLKGSLPTVQEIERELEKKKILSEIEKKQKKKPKKKVTKAKKKK